MLDLRNKLEKEEVKKEEEEEEEEDLEPPSKKAKVTLPTTTKTTLIMNSLPLDQMGHPELQEELVIVEECMKKLFRRKMNIEFNLKSSMEMSEIIRF
jgi:hypothetical protein